MATDENDPQNTMPSNTILVDLPPLHSVVGTSGNDRLKGTRGNDGLHGGAGDDLLAGGNGNDSYWGGKGNDKMIDTGGSDTYYFGRGMGKDIIEDISTPSGISADGVLAPKETDRLVLEGGLKPGNIHFKREGDNLILDFKPMPGQMWTQNQDDLTIKNYFKPDTNGSDTRIEEIRFKSDHSVITFDDVNKAVTPIVEKGFSLCVQLDQITDVHQVSGIVSDWAKEGVQVKALNYGTETKRYYPAELDAALTVVREAKGLEEYAGFGVKKGTGGSEVNAHQAIELSFDKKPSNVTIGLGALFDGSNPSTYDYNKQGHLEQAQWVAYSADGKKSMTGIVKGTADGLAAFTIKANFDIARVDLKPVGDTISNFSLHSVTSPDVTIPPSGQVNLPVIQPMGPGPVLPPKDVILQADYLVHAMASFSSPPLPGQTMPISSGLQTTSLLATSLDKHTK